MFSLPAAAALNHLLASESWATDALRSFAGKTAAISVPPFDLKLTVLPDGTLSAADDAAEPSVEISVPPQLVAAALRGDESAFKSAKIEGDPEFARTIHLLFRNLRWDVEEDLSRFTGDIIAHRLATSAKSLFSWQTEARERLQQNLAEYLVEERQLLAKSDQVQLFVTEVDCVRDDAERLGKRIDKLGSGKRAKPN